MGKGSKRRLSEVSEEEMAERWGRVFGVDPVVGPDESVGCVVCAICGEVLTDKSFLVHRCESARVRW